MAIVPVTKIRPGMTIQLTRTVESVTFLPGERIQIRYIGKYPMEEFSYADALPDVDKTGGVVDPA